MPDAPATTGNPVPVPGEVCTLKDVAAFKPGNWNDEGVTLSDMQDMVRNYELYSTGKNPFYRPFVTLNHKDELNAGEVVGCRIDENQIMRLDAANVPTSVGSWWNARRLRDPSIEYWKPVRNAAGELIGSFVRPDGTFSDTFVLRALTLLGNDAPGVKGLPPQPIARFSTNGPFHSFGGSVMDRTTMIQTLQAAGVDVSTITDAVPDALLQSIVESLQKLAQKPDAPAPAADVTMADVNGTQIPVGTPAAATPAASGIPAGGLTIPSPTSITAKFSDRFKDVKGIGDNPAMVVFMAGLDSQLESLTRNSAAGLAFARQQELNAKASAISSFADRMKDKVPPALLVTQCKLFATLDHSQVRRFSDGKRFGTQLAEALFDFESTWVPTKDMAERIKQGPPVVGNNQTADGKMDPARKAAMMKADPFFANRKAK